MSSDKEKLIAELVNKGLDGDMDSVNACDDKIIRAKAKAMIMKVKKGTLDRPEIPLVVSDTPTNDHKEENVQDNVEDSFQKIKKMIADKFPDSLIEHDKGDHVQVKPEQWSDIACLLYTSDAADE